MSEVIQYCKMLARSLHLSIATLSTKENIIIYIIQKHSLFILPLFEPFYGVIKFILQNGIPNITPLVTHCLSPSLCHSKHEPLTFLPSVCPYSMVSTCHHSKNFVSTYSKTVRHGGRVLALI